jgi:hypothetical protein
MGTLLRKSSFGLKLQGRVRDALISPERPLARGGAARPTGSSTTIAKIPQQANTIGLMTTRSA